MRFAAILLAGILIVGCDKPAAKTTATISGDQVKKEIREAGDAVGQYTREQKDEYLRKTKTELDKLDGQIDQWKARLKDQSAETRAKMEKQLEALEKHRAEAGRHYENLKSDSQDAWKEVQKGFGRAYDELRDAVEKAKKHFE